MQILPGAKYAKYVSVVLVSRGQAESYRSMDSLQEGGMLQLQMDTGQSGLKGLQDKFKDV